MFKDISGANIDVIYKVDEVNISKNWNPSLKDPDKMGGFNFTTYDSVIRWVCRGDTLYDVIIPEDAQL